MSKFSLSKKSESRLVGVHPDLVAVVHRAIREAVLAGDKTRLAALDAQIADLRAKLVQP